MSYAAFTSNDYLVLEKDAELGGYCKTIKEKDFVWDYSGHFFHFQNKWVEEFVMPGVESEILDIEKRTSIYYKGHRIEFPFQKNIHQLSQDEFIDCLYDLFNNPQTDFTTFKQMLYAKFGKSIAEKFLIPYNEKLYACDLDRLDVDAMGRFFPYADKEDIIRNFKPSKDHSYNARFKYPRGGAIEYIKSVVKRLDAGKIHCNEKLLRVDTQNQIVYSDKGEYPYDNLISSVPFPTLLELCGVSYDRAKYSSNQVLTFNIGFDKGNEEIKDQWIYFQDKSLVFYRVGFYNNIFGTEKLSVYVEIGLKSDAEIDEQAYLERALSDLQRVGIVKDHKVEAYSTVVMNPAYVHVSKQMERDREEKKSLLASNHIYSIGRYGSWCYCSIEDNIIEAKRLSEHLV